MTVEIFYPNGESEVIAESSSVEKINVFTKFDTLNPLFFTEGGSINSIAIHAELGENPEAVGKNVTFSISELSLVDPTINRHHAISLIGKGDPMTIVHSK